MEMSSVRIHNLTIRDFKNVEWGSIDFACSKTNSQKTVDIMGLYGQNGSGKTALIESLAVLKTVLCGQSIPDDYANYITIDKQFSNMSFTFEIQSETETFKAKYSFALVKTEAEGESNIVNSDSTKQYRVTIANEVLSMSGMVAGKKQKWQHLINTAPSDSPFVPQTKYAEVIGNSKVLKHQLMVYRKLTSQRSQSFIFYRDTLKTIRENCVVSEYTSILNALVQYGNYGLHVIDTKSAGLINLNAALPFFFKLDSEQSLSVGSVAIQLNGSSTIPTQVYDVIQRVISNMNAVLEQIVPGLTVSLKQYGKALLRDSREGCIVELMATRGGKAIPLRYESEGIKRIVSILQLLIVMYNNEGMTVAIDELDAGVFEYLFGELLKVVSESGKGQLIFTSHNLRPLETIDKKFVYFTTTNPKNRYMQLENVKTNNNMRQLYYRRISLGGQKEELYDLTNNYEIVLSFVEAGEFCVG